MLETTPQVIVSFLETARNGTRSPILNKTHDSRKIICMIIVSIGSEFHRHYKIVIELEIVLNKYQTSIHISSPI